MKFKTPKIEGSYFEISELSETDFGIIRVQLGIYLPSDKKGLLVKNLKKPKHIFFNQYLNNDWGYKTKGFRYSCENFNCLNYTSGINAALTYLNSEINSLIDYSEEVSEFRRMVIEQTKNYEEFDENSVDDFK